MSSKFFIITCFLLLIFIKEAKAWNVRTIGTVSVMIFSNCLNLISLPEMVFSGEFPYLKNWHFLMKIFKNIFPNFRTIFEKLKSLWSPLNYLVHKTFLGSLNIQCHSKHTQYPKISPNGYLYYWMMLSCYLVLHLHLHFSKRMSSVYRMDTNCITFCRNSISSSGNITPQGILQIK